MKIRVPATSANLGPGFDSCGVALDRYLFVEVIEDSETWLVSHELGTDIPTNEENLLVATALQLVPDLSPKHLKMSSDIPVTRGLGSSSSVIVAGIELANRLGNLNMSDAQKIAFGTKLEGHPDNVAPAVCGDLVIASAVENQVDYVRHYFPPCDIIAFIPEAPLSTEKARSALPQTLGYKEAVAASSVANVMVAALLTGNLPVAGRLMEKDRFHENYRGPLVPHLQVIRDLAHEEGAYGCFLSGAGPTVLILSPEDRSQKIVQLLKAWDQPASVELLSVDREGVQVF